MRVLCTSIFLATVLSASCQAQVAGSAPTEHYQSSPVIDDVLLEQLLTAKRPPHKYAADDTISLHIFGIKDYLEEQRIAEDGTVIFPLVGKMTVAGLTNAEVNDIVSSKLITSGVILEPQVSVTEVKLPSEIVTVSGYVSKPGVFPAVGDLTILDYLSQAGAFSDNIAAINVAQPSTTVTLIRPSLKGPVNVPLGADPKVSPYARIPVFPGDEIIVGKAGTVYAVGAFRLQGGYPLKSNSPTTLTELVALAGGVGFEADLADAHIVRTLGKSRFLLPVNVSKVLHGKAPDVALTDEDILFVPTNQLKAAIKGGGTGLVVTFATAYLYTH